MTYDKVEREYKDFTPSMKRGIHKYSSLTADEMVQIREFYQQKTGKIAGNIYNKQGFYNFCDKNIKKSQLRRR